MLRRYEKNPILRPKKRSFWEARAVFNPAACYLDNQVHLIYRAVGFDRFYISRLGYARSEDGITFKRFEKPIIYPQRNYERWGCEDPRITLIKKRIVLTYVSLIKPAKVGGGPPRTSLAISYNFFDWEKFGNITPLIADDRDCVIFSEKIKGKYVMLHRPHNWIKGCLVKKEKDYYVHLGERFVRWDMEMPKRFPEKPSIWICYSKNLKEWKGHKVLLEPKYSWEFTKIGSGPPPLKTRYGWLLIYHGVEYKGERRIYTSGAVLLKKRNPEKIISRTKKPILYPKKNYEIKGDVSNVVFPTGAIKKEKDIYVYYGSADKYCCLAYANLNDFCKKLKKGLI